MIRFVAEPVRTRSSAGPAPTRSTGMEAASTPGATGSTAGTATTFSSSATAERQEA